MNEFENEQLKNMPNEHEKEVFVIKDLSGLNWAFKKMRLLKKKMDEINLIADTDIKSINDWRERELEKYESDASYFEYKIMEYQENELLKDDKNKSISTPYGIVKSRKTKEQPEKCDLEKIINYAKHSAPELVRVIEKEELMWSELKKKLNVIEHNGDKVVIDEYGVIVPGVIVKPESVKITVEVND